MIFSRQPTIPKSTPIPQKKTCKVKIRKTGDGSIIKSIEGDCTKEQLRALANENTDPDD